MSAFPFVGGSYTARSRNFDNQRCLNLYVENSGSGNSKSPAMLVGTPGREVWAVGGSSGNGGCRGLHRFSDSIALVVINDAVHTVSPAAVITPIGTILPGTTPVGLADNGSIIMLVTGTEGYFINPVLGTVTQIFDPDFVAGVAVDFLAGRFVWPKANTGQFQWTEVYGTDIDALSFTTAEASPDIIVSQIAGFGELWEFGQNSTEVFQPSTDADEPYVKVQGAAMEIGCIAPYSVAKIDSSFLWLGRSDEGTGIVWRAINYQPQRISTHAVEFAIASYGNVTDAVAFTYQQEGHSFYVLSFPSANKTWCYDVSTNLWHERAFRNTDTGALERIKPVCQMSFANSTIVGNYEFYTLHKWKLDEYTDGPSLDGQPGIPIPRIRACQHLSADLKRQFFHSLQIDMETGVGLAVLPTINGYNPQASLRWSDDGGYNWSNAHLAPIGKTGERKRRVRWRRLGWARDRVFEVTITDPVKVCIVGATAEVTVGAS